MNVLIPACRQAHLKRTYILGIIPVEIPSTNKLFSKCDCKLNAGMSQKERNEARAQVSKLAQNLVGYIDSGDSTQQCDIDLGSL